MVGNRFGVGHTLLHSQLSREQVNNVQMVVVSPLWRGPGNINNSFIPDGAVVSGNSIEQGRTRFVNTNRIGWHADTIIIQRSLWPFRLKADYATYIDYENEP